MSRRAVILAGGQGTRLKPYTISLPKALVPVGNRPVLEIIISQLIRYGFDHITMAVNHMADIIKAFFGDGSKWGITIDYSLEDKPLHTMGPLRLIKRLPDNFLVMNADVLTNLDYASFFDQHARNNALFTISAFMREQKVDFGVLRADADGRLVEFLEKPVYPYMVSMGIYAVNRRVIDLIPPDQPFGFDDLMIKMIELGEPARAIPFDGYWLDIGRPEDYEQACREQEFMRGQTE